MSQEHSTCKVHSVDIWIFFYCSDFAWIHFGKRVQGILHSFPVSRNIKVARKKIPQYPHCEVGSGWQISKTYLVSVRIIFLEIKKPVDNRVHHGVGTCEKEKSFLYCLVQIMKGFFIYKKPETKEEYHQICQNVIAIMHSFITMHARLYVSKYQFTTDLILQN